MAGPLHRGEENGSLSIRAKMSPLGTELPGLLLLLLPLLLLLLLMLLLLLLPLLLLLSILGAASHKVRIVLSDTHQIDANHDCG